MVKISAKDVNQHMLVKAVAEFLKSKNPSVPEWTDVVKLSVRNELAPYNSDWYYVRLASVLRHLYIRAPVGVGALMKVYGGRKRRGTRPSHFSTGSGSVARKALQTLEELGLAEKTEKGGRQLSRQGRRDMDRIAVQVFGKMKEKHDFVLI